MVNEPDPPPPSPPIEEEPPPALSRDTLFVTFFFAVFFFLIYQLFLFIAPFASSLLLAGVLAITLWPVHVRVVVWLRGSRTLGAIATTLGTVLLVLVPLMILLTMLVNEAADFYQRAEGIGDQVREERQALVEAANRAADRLEERLPFLASLDLSGVPVTASKRIAGWVAEQGQALAAGAAATVIGAGMMLVALFFFFRDGDRIAALARELIPMRTVYRDRVLARLYDTLQVVVQSSLAIAVLQGIVGGIGYALLGGLSVSVFLAFLTAVASLVPVAGSALIWVPTAIYVLLTAEAWRGIALLVWGAVAIGSVDNIVRPLMIGGRVQIPTVLLLFAILGGIQVYGVLGIVLAPVVVAILIGFVEIYRERLAVLRETGTVDAG